MKIIFSILIILGFLFVSQSFSSTSKDGVNMSMDEIYKKRIIGKWSEGTSPYGISSFETGGKYRAWVYENSKKEKLLHSMKGKWWIENGQLYNKADEITPPIPGLKMDEIVVDRIVNISEDAMTLIDEEGLQYTKIKIKE